MSVRLTTARRLVIKIGSSLLVDQQSGALRRDWLDALADDVAVCRGRGQGGSPTQEGRKGGRRRAAPLPPGPPGSRRGPPEAGI